MFGRQNPDDIHMVLRRRAAAAGQSLQEYLLSRWREDTASETLDEVLDRVEQRTGGELSFETATALVRARARLRREVLVAPELIDLEVASVLRRHASSGRVSVQRADRAISNLAALPLMRVPHRRLLARCWELRHNLTTYDGAYVAVAESVDAVLLTTDARLSQAPGPTCEFEVLG